MSPQEKFGAPLRRGKEDAPTGPPIAGVHPGDKPAPITPEAPKATKQKPKPPIDVEASTVKPDTSSGSEHAPEHVTKPRAIDRESLRTQKEKEPSHESEPSGSAEVPDRQEAPDMNQTAREHAEKRGIVRESRISSQAELEKELSNARYNSGSIGLATALALNFVFPATLGSLIGIGVPVAAGTLVGVGAYRYFRKKAVKRAQMSTSVMPPVRAETQDSSTSTNEQADVTLQEGKSELTLAEAIERGVVQPHVHYRTGSFFGDLIGGRYHLTDSEFQRMKNDATYKEKLLRGKAPRFGIGSH